MKKFLIFLISLSSLSHGGNAQKQCEALKKSATIIDADYLKISSQNPGKYTFEERKYFADFAEPLISSGILIYQPPAIIEKHVLTPYEVRYILKDQLMIQETSDQKQRRLNANDHPMVKSFISTLRAILQGDNNKLLDEFSIYPLPESTSNTQDLCFFPKDQQIQKYISLVTIHITNQTVSAIRWYDTKAGITELTILKPVDSPNKINKTVIH